MHEQVLDLLIEYYLNLSRVEKSEYWNKDIFEDKVYTAWAVHEIYEDLKNNPNESPIGVIEEFISKMDMYSLKNIKTSRIFSIAYDAGMDILDQLITMKEENNYEQI